MATIKVLQNGPYLVQGDDTVKVQVVKLGPVDGENVAVRRAR